MKIGVIMGGISTEREVSLSSGKEIMDNIDRSKYEVKQVIIDKKDDIIEKTKDIDFALLALHGKYGEDGNVQAILESLDIPYSGCDMLSSAISMNKDISKAVLKSRDIRTAPWIIYGVGDEVLEKDIKSLGYPVVSKPNSGGSSVATYICSNFEEVKDAVKDGLNYDNEVMVEKFIGGDEVTVPILDGEVLPTLIIKPQMGGFFDYESKYQAGGATEEIIVFEENLQSEIDKLALDTYNALKCSVYSRVDLIIKDKVPYVLEINTLPGMTKTSLFPKSASHVGISFSGLIDRIIEVSLRERSAE
ncbi:MAG: D-alanine--D-alanine ligase [Clostridium sp.]|nr:D-alanine--D-alanine ligase [Clostridium sp.]